MPPLPLVLLPFASGVLYSFAALFIKRGLQHGMDALRITFAMNMAMGMASLSFLLFDSTPQEGAAWYMPVLAACAYTAGATFNTFALLKGDVSVATPLLGTKVLFVAVFAVLINGVSIPPALWGAGVLVVLALFLLRGPAGGATHNFGLTVILSLASAASFALCDSFFQQFAQIWGYSRFIPTVFIIGALLTCGLIPFFPKRETAPPPEARRARWCAASINAVQAMGIAICLSLWVGGATTVNILYSSRGLWTVALVWSIGHWFANTERDLGRSIMLRRLAGAVILTSAIVLALLFPPPPPG